MVFHLLNRAVGRRNLFDKPGDVEAFERVLKESLHFRPIRVCGYCWMSNHGTLCCGRKTQESSRYNPKSAAEAGKSWVVRPWYCGKDDSNGMVIAASALFYA